MQVTKPRNIFWLFFPGVLLAAFYLKATAAIEPAACSVTTVQDIVPQGRELGGEFEVLSWNIQKANNPGWAEDLAGFSEDIDLAFIQEASKQADISQAIGHDLHSSFAAGYTTASRTTGVLTLSTGSPSAHCALTAMEPWLGTPKATSIAAYPLQGREDRLLAINLHAINFDLGLDSFSLQFEALTEALANHAGPIILAGDLNTWSDDRQSLVDNFLQEYGLASVAFEPDLRTRAFGRAVDHIYIRGLRADNAQVIAVSSSDHNALRVTLGVL
jgi:endonuclease/exonuclease/phosphatase (EEP) superfamily protein YafD